MVHSAFLLASFVAAVRAANDWTKPCLSGVCEFDLPSSASGTMKIWGSEGAIADITTAAGWQVLGCDPNAVSQDIRIVCTGEPATCAHLFDGSGPDGKIVRLPKNCGKNAFARVAKTWVPTDQSLPPAVATKIARRADEQPEVKALQIDTNFAAVDSSKTGPVNFAIKGANVPGINNDINESAIKQRRSRIYGKRATGNFVDDAMEVLSTITRFDTKINPELPPLKFSKRVDLLNQQISCPAGAAALKMNMEASANAEVTVGVAATGTIIPPKINDFAIFSSLSANFDGSFDMSATASGSLAAENVKLFEGAIAGINFPGILTVAPTLEVTAHANANLDLKADLTLGISYRLEDAELVFPPDSQKFKSAEPANSFKFGNSPLKLSASPSVKARGTVEARLIPRLNFKVAAFGDAVNTAVFLEMGASASMKLSSDTVDSGGPVVANKANTTAPVLPAKVNTPAKAPSIRGRALGFSNIKAAAAKFAPSGNSSTKAAPTTPTSTPPVAAIPAKPATVDFKLSSVVAATVKATPTTAASVKTPSVAATPVGAAPFKLSSPKAASPFAIPAAVPAPPVLSNITAKPEPPTIPKTGSIVPIANIPAAPVGIQSAAKDPSVSSPSTGAVNATSANTPVNADKGANTAAIVANAPVTPLQVLPQAKDSSASNSTSAPVNAAGIPAPAVPASPVAATTNTAKTFSGCIDLKTTLDVNAGANGNFFGLFNQNTKKVLFSKQFQTLNKCFGNTRKPSRRSYPRIYPRKLVARALSCPAANIGQPVPVTNEVIQAAPVTPKL